MRRAGFSLLELSIVLVIIALLTGGIMAGKSLVRNTELKSITIDAQKYRGAIGQFRGQYTALPGDYLRATKYWGIRAGSTGSDASCWDATSTDQLTCNGNGDGLIGSPDGTRWTELFLAWQHLSNAGLITGSYTGAGSAMVHIPGTNSPSSKISANATFMLQTLTNITSGQTSYFSNHDGELRVARMTYAGIDSTGNVTAPILKPSEAAEIDTKLDDGSPAYGEIIAPRSTNTKAPNCTTGSTPDTGVYNIAFKSLACSLTWHKAY